MPRTKVTPKSMRTILAAAPNNMAKVYCDDHDFESHQFWDALEARELREYYTQLGLKSGDVWVVAYVDGERREYEIRL